jgi:deoxyribose-phosphate aldolase
MNRQDFEHNYRALFADAAFVEVCGSEAENPLEAVVFPTEVAELAGMIDHTILKADAVPEQIHTLCEEARQYRFASVCVNASYVPMCKELLNGTGVDVCCVVGFPLGATSTVAKACEAEQALREGATEIDMVLHIGLMKARAYASIFADIAAVATVTHRQKARLKVILETCLLTDEEKMKASLIAKKAGADFVKTSTGFSTGGATADDIRLMRSVVGPAMGVKASGGIRTTDEAIAMVRAGASRIGASAGIAIVKGLASR